MTMELLKIGKNGQMEIDFESLEALTNAEFVKMVKTCIETHERKENSILIKFFPRSDNDALTAFRMMLYVNNACYYFVAFDLDRKDKTLEYQKSMIPYGVIERFVELVGEK